MHKLITGWQGYVTYLKITVSLDVTACCLIVTDVLDEPAASMFRSVFSHEDGGRRFLCC
jgi:hypothetical protein